MNLVDTTKSPRAKKLKDRVATYCRESVSVLIGPFNVRLKNCSLTLLNIGIKKKNKYDVITTSSRLRLFTA